MPKLLQINSTANWGSTGKIAEQIGTLVLSNGWESYIAYGRYANKSKSKLIKIGSRFGMLCHLVESRLFDNHGLASRLATRRLIKEIKRINPDIIHLHNIHGYYLNYKILFNYLNSVNTPIVWTLHDCWSFTGHCAHFINAKCYKWKYGCENCSKYRDYPKAFIDHSQQNYNLKKRLFAYKNNVFFAPVSKWLSDFVGESYFQHNRRDVFHNGIDVHVYTPSKWTQTDKIKIIGVSSVWNNDKGLDDFYKLREILDPNKYEITLVGLNQEQKEYLPEGINGILRTNSAEELAKLYSSATVFINPTYADTYPTTNLEALACGTPVITYKTGGSPESITANTGFVVEQGDISGVINAIKEIESRGKQYYSDACRKYAEEHFDKDKCFAKYIDLYNELLNNTK
ncbi:MAG: glycosyltransferase [Alistipes sp.]|nr:glycosyltransferase [Alistipes sp.]